MGNEERRGWQQYGISMVEGVHAYEGGGGLLECEESSAP